MYVILQLVERKKKNTIHSGTASTLAPSLPPPSPPPTPPCLAAHFVAALYHWYVLATCIPLPGTIITVARPSYILNVTTPLRVTAKEREKTLATLK